MTEISKETMIDDNQIKNDLLDSIGIVSKEPQYFSVTEISSKIRLLLENNLGRTKIKGEISGFKLATSGHAYFSLKDDKSVIAATCWRHSIERIKFKLEEGLEVIVTGRITAYAGQSKYQISVEEIAPAGEGAFMQILRERKMKLQSEGLFDPSIKKPIPFFPKVIGIVTSPTGAVIRDIIHRISDRCPTHLLIWPVAVQGSSSAEEVSRAIDGFNNLPLACDAYLDQKKETNDAGMKSRAVRPDVIIVARGGGSIEDLWSFNEEIVVRSVYNSKIPIISAIGHETDFTLIDLAADKRAPTPTAAAEFAVPVLMNLRYTLDSRGNHIHSKIIQKLASDTKILESYNRIMLYPAGYFNSYAQKLDDVNFKLNSVFKNFLKAKLQSISSFPASRFYPRKSISRSEIKLSSLGSILENNGTKHIDILENRLKISLATLDSLDYKKVLKRGFVMIKDLEKGTILQNSHEIKLQKEVEIVTFDESIKAQIL